MTDETLFSDALALPDPAARAAFLAHACPDAGQRQRVEELLAAHFADGSFLARPAGADLAATVALRTGDGTGTFDAAGTRDLSPPPDSTQAEAGVVIAGRYTLVEPIGEGGMGSVWRARQTEPVKRFVAVKLIKAGMDSKLVLARFEAERQALALMDHPHIAKVLDGGLHDGRPFFVMELVKGTPITEFCDVRKLMPNARLELFVQACQAIQHAHQKGVIHRDLKPSNVLVALYDDKPVVKVIDFGVAKASGAALTERTLDTGFGGIVGTPEYMSPEQATFNNLDVDTRTDVYALGVLLYELMVGSPPFSRKELEKKGLLEMLRVVREEEPPRPSTKLSTSQARAGIAASRGVEPEKLAGLMKGELDWIVMKALEKDRARRYDTANGFAADVQRYLSGEQVQAVPPSVGYRLAKAYRRNEAGVLVASVFALLLTVGIVTTTLLAIQANRAELAAHENASRAGENEAAADRAADEARAERDRVGRANAELRLTRYIAEMNLVQTGHASGDLGEVKRLLETQPPDLRGLEWHYWDRRMNGFERECRVSCPPEVLLRAGALHHDCVLAADGRTLAVFLSAEDAGWTVQVWDVVDNRQLRTFRLPSNLPADGHKIESSSFPHLSATADGRAVVLDRMVWRGTRAGSRNPGAIAPQHWRIDLTTGEILDVDACKPPGERGFAHVTEDGRHLVTGLGRAGSGDQENRISVTRIGDNTPLGEITASEYSYCRVGPDGQHVLVYDARPFVRPPAKSRVTGAIAYWRIGEKEPLWKEEVNLDHTDDRFAYGPDGRTLRHMALADGFWQLVTRDLTNGKVLRADQVVAAHEVREHRLLSRRSRPSFNPAWALSPDCRRLAFATPTGLAVCDLGLARPTGEPLPGFTSPTVPVRYALETYEGPPQHIAFLPDGRVAASFSMTTGPAGIRTRSTENPALAQVFAPPPYGIGVDHATEVLAAHGSEKFLLRPHRRTPGDPSSAVERLCVLDGSGRLLFGTDLGPAPPAAVGSVQDGSYEFSRDGRYLYGVDEFKDRPQPLRSVGDLVVRDVHANREAMRLSPAPGDRYFLPSLDDAGKRVVVSVKDRDIPEFGLGSRIKAARVYEVPSGKHMLDLEIPKDAENDPVRFDPAGFINKKHRVRGDVERTTHRWTPDGKYLGKEPGLGWQRDRPETEEWQERGNRVVRIRSNLSDSGRFNAPGYERRVDIWDAGRRGPHVPPLVSFEVPDGMCLLSPDGTRLLVSGITRGVNVRAKTSLHCTSTGREVLVLASELAMGRRVSRQDFGLWSPDGHHFWYGVDGDGKPVGWDFRPREDAKK